jgi:hypothetical protein
MREDQSSKANSERIVARIAEQIAGVDAIEALARTLSPTDLQSLMLHVYAQRSRQRKPADLLAQFEQSALLEHSDVDARLLLNIELRALQCAKDFSAVELSPVAPLGTNQVLGRIDQNNCLATIRNAEVLADPTTAMALHCAKLRRRDPSRIVRLAARSRLVRLQPFKGPGFTPHFSTFSMATAGRDTGSLGFELTHLREHLSVYAEFLVDLQSNGYALTNIRMTITETDGNEDRIARAEAAVLEPLRKRFPGICFDVDRQRTRALTYYRDYCLEVSAAGKNGEVFNLGDGGFTDWTQRLLSNAKERMLVSAIGTERIARLAPPNTGGRP